MPEFTFQVRGRLVKCPTGQPMAGHSVITETGIRGKASLASIGVRGCRGTNESGVFNTTFVTVGGKSVSSKTKLPAMIEVHVELGPGVWCCTEVSADRSRYVLLGPRIFAVDLGTIEFDGLACRLPASRRKRRSSATPVLSEFQRCARLANSGDPKLMGLAFLDLREKAQGGSLRRAERELFDRLRMLMKLLMLVPNETSDEELATILDRTRLLRDRSDE